MDLAQEENLVVFYIRLPRETERLCRKKLGMQENLVLNQLTSEGEKGNQQAFSSVPKVKAQTDVTSSTSLESSPATRAKNPCAWDAKFTRSSCDFRRPPVCRD